MAKEKSSVQEAPFLGDKLERQDVAEYLTKYLLGKHAVSRDIAKYRSFVLNLNSEWGAGKTYFLTEWAKKLRKSGHVVITFDAWRNDFSEQPLIGFMAEIEEQLRAQLPDQIVQVELDGLVAKGKKLFKVVAPALLLHGVKLASGVDVSALLKGDLAAASEGADLGDSAAKVADMIKDQLYKENEDTKQAIGAFKAQLKRVINVVTAEGEKSLPLFFFVDELDRCRPSFSIELLEDIKHLFGIEGVYFVIATDSAQLAHSVQAVYGQGFDARAYLRRFFDQEYSLPDPDRFNFINHLFAEYGLGNERRLYCPLDLACHENTNLAVVAVARCADYFRLSLRDQDQVCAMLDAIRLTSETMTLHVMYLSFLIMLRLKHGDVFDAFCRRQIGIATVIEQLGELRTIDRGVSIKETAFNDDDIGNETFRPIADMINDYGSVAGDPQQTHRLRKARNSTARALWRRLETNANELAALGQYPHLVKSASGLIHLVSVKLPNDLIK